MATLRLWATTTPSLTGRIGGDSGSPSASQLPLKSALHSTAQTGAAHFGAPPLRGAVVLPYSSLCLCARLACQRTLGGGRSAYPTPLCSSNYLCIDESTHADDTPTLRAANHCDARRTRTGAPCPSSSASLAAGTASAEPGNERQASARRQAAGGAASASSFFQCQRLFFVFCHAISAARCHRKCHAKGPRGPQ